MTWALARLLATRDLVQVQGGGVGFVALGRCGEANCRELGEMEAAGRPYGQGGCVLAVHMDCQHALPPLDLALLQVLLSAVVCGTVGRLAITTVPLHYCSALECKIL